MVANMRSYTCTGITHYLIDSYRIASSSFRQVFPCGFNMAIATLGYSYTELRSSFPSSEGLATLKILQDCLIFFKAYSPWILDTC